MVQKSSSKVKRREFLASVAALPFLGTWGKPSPESSVSEDYSFNRRDGPLRLGVIGYGNRGEALSNEVLLNDQKAEIRAVCDVFTQRLEKGLATAGEKAVGYGNYLDLLDDRDIDAVIIATPDHWHAQMALDAAGKAKHIYLEKCMTRTQEEARALKDAVKTSGVVFQLGHQGRQRDLNLKARELLAKNIAGKVTLVETTTNRNDPEGGWKTGEGELASSENIDWELFQGPARNRVPFSPERYYGWRNYWDYGSGMSGDLLSNEFDMVNSILDLGIPESAIATGGLYFHRDGREVPDVFQAAFEYPEKELSLLYSGTLASGIPRGTLFMGRDASLELGRILSVWVDKKSIKYKSRIKAGIIDPDAPFVNYMADQDRVDGISSATSKYYADRGLVRTYREGKQLSTSLLHLSEWLNCIRSKRQPSCNIDRGFEVAVAVHMATLSFKEGRRVRWDPGKQSIM
jgi:predicted dehydrogenase